MKSRRTIGLQQLLTYLPNNATIPAVPLGVKSNVFLVVSVAENNAQKQHGKCHILYDDCGTWTNTRGFHSVVVGNDCKELYERDGLVCDRKRIDGKQQLVPLTLPQCVKSLGIFTASHCLRGLHKMYCSG